MPSKIECPLTPEELRELYKANTLRQMVEVLAARGITISRTRLMGWMDEAGIERHRYSPFTEERIDCPFSKARLYELYWIEEKSLEEIGVLACGLLEREKVYDKTIRRWMDEAGVERRSPRQWLKLRTRKDPKRWKEHGRQMGLQNAGKAPVHPLSPRDRKKGIRVAATKKKASRPYETRICALPGCNNEVTRPASLFRNPPERTFCCRSHAASLTRKLHVAMNSWDVDPWEGDE